MMQNAIKITDSIYWIGGNDRETDLFEGLWTLPRGVAYNAYFINDEKTAVIDTIKADKLSDYIERLVSILPAGKGIDYLIVNHMEPDHSGSISIMRKLYPEMKIIGNKKTLEMIEAFYGIHDGVVEVKEGEILDLGRHKLAFATIPMVHWPESMVTYDTTDKVLFSTDAFGGFCALEGGIFDDELDMKLYEDETLRYFANIVGRYSMPTQKAIAKVRALDLKIICPAHGPIRLRLDVRQHEADDRRHCARGMRGGRQGRHRTRRLALESFLHRPRRMEVPRPRARQLHLQHGALPARRDALPHAQEQNDEEPLPRHLRLVQLEQGRARGAPGVRGAGRRLEARRADDRGQVLPEGAGPRALPRARQEHGSGREGRIR